MLPKTLYGGCYSLAIAHLAFDHRASRQANLCEPTQYLAVAIDHHFGSTNR
jgi:hypothetical protein